MKGEPYNLIKSKPIRDEHYSMALDILISRYENRRIIASTHLDRILDIEPFTQETNLNIRYLVNIYIENMKALEIRKFPVQEWSFLLLNTLLRKIPNSLRLRYERSLSNSKTEIPKVDSI